MGYATAYSPCGCYWTRLMEPVENIFIAWVKCAEHYVPEIDNPKILEAAINRQRHEEQLYMEAIKFFHGGK